MMYDVGAALPRLQSSDSALEFYNGNLIDCEHYI